MTKEDSTAYAQLWTKIYIASMDADVMVTFKKMEELFMQTGALQAGKPVPEKLYLTAPYLRAVALRK